MATYNEKVCDIVREMKSLAESSGTKRRVNIPTLTVHHWIGLADRIESAHKREVAKLKTAYDRAVSADARHAVENERLKGEVAELTAIINAECRKCGECAKFGKDCTAGDIDGAEDNRACEKFVSREVAELRECLAGALDVVDSTVARLGIAEKVKSNEDYKRWRKALKMKSKYAVIRQVNHKYNGRVFQVVTYGYNGAVTGICNVCKTPDDAENFCREIGVTDIRREGC